MTLYVYPPSGTVLISPAGGTDFATETTLAAVETAVDGLENLVTSTNTKLDILHADNLVIEGYIDGIETAIASTNTKLDTLHTDVDGLETLIGTTNTNVAATNTLLTNKLSGSLVNVQYDNFAFNGAGATTDIYTYKLAAATVKTVTISYVDATKQVITTVTAV